MKQERVRARGGRGCAFGENPSPSSNAATLVRFKPRARSMPKAKKHAAAAKRTAQSRPRDPTTQQFLSNPVEEPDGVDEWPEPTDAVTYSTEEDEDLFWIVDDNGEEGEEKEEDGEDELRSQEGRLDAVAPELAQFVTLFEQDTTRRKLFKTGFTENGPLSDHTDLSLTTAAVPPQA